jgi:hypothetical protein
VISWFSQAFAFSHARNLYRYDASVVLEKLKTNLQEGWMDLPPSVVGLCRLNQVDP